MVRLALAVVLLSALRVSAATFTVDHVGDASDASPGDGNCATATQACTLRAAIEEANALAGADVIGFGIAGAILPASVLPAVTDTVTIDGTTAPEYAGEPLVFLGGSDVLADGLRFLAGSDGSTLRGLQVTDFTNDGVHVRSAGVSIVDNVLAGNDRAGLFSNGATGLTITGNLVGLTASGGVHGNSQAGLWLNLGSGITVGAPGAGNTISGQTTGIGIRIDRVTSSTIEANTIGLATDGTTARPNRDGMIVHRTAEVSITGNVISAHTQSAIVAEIGTHLDISGNRIGTDATGMLSRPNNATPVVLLDITESDVRDNLISGNAGGALLLSAGTTDNRVYGNIIGRNATNTAPLPNGIGSAIIIAQAADNVIGSPELGGNVIAHSEVDGVEVREDSIRNTIAANSMFGNGNLGINLLPGAFITPNDAGDDDTGGNGLQNFPVLDSAVNRDTDTRVSGTLNSTPNTPFTIHFYREDFASDFHPPQGRTYLDAHEVTTDALGNATFVVSLPPIPVGEHVTATATGAASGTSEFAAQRGVRSLPLIAFADGTVSVNENEPTATLQVIRTGDLSVPGTVDFTVTPGTATAESDYSSTSGTVVFAPGEQTKEISIPLLADSSIEADETFVVTLSNAVLGTLSDPSQATVTIVDDDLPSLSITDLSEPEGSGTDHFLVEVTLSEAVDDPVTVSWTTEAGGTADAGTDYTPESGTLTFGGLDTDQVILIEIRGDPMREPDEHFFIRLFDAEGATIADDLGRIEILNDDLVPTMSVQNVVESEDHQALHFVIQLSNPSSEPISVHYETADDTAIAPSDYTSTSGDAVIAPGETTFQVDVPVVDDALFEPFETMRFILSDPDGAVLSDGEAFGGIQNDDAAPPAEAQVPTVSEWGLIVMGMLLAAVAALRLARAS